MPAERADADSEFALPCDITVAAETATITYPHLLAELRAAADGHQLTAG